MAYLLNLDTERNEIVDQNYIDDQLPSTSVLFTGNELDSIVSPSHSSSGYIYGDSSNAFNMDTLNIDVNSAVSVMDMEAVKTPYLEIMEQPIDKFRFRYLTEMRGTHGCLLGKSTDKNRKSYPACQLMNFTGNALIRCSLYQVDKSTLRHHSHNLVVRRDDDFKYPDDIEVSPTKGYKAVFVGMGVIQAVKKFVVGQLHEKLVNQVEFEKGREITEREKQQLRNKAERDAKNMNLNRVCLCFEAFQLIDGNWVSLCEPVLSNPINNAKCTHTNELKITRLSTAISEANGGKEMFLFVEKVGKKNIKVRFFETDKDEQEIWEDWGVFTETDVHHQYAIALRTPPYKDKDIEGTVDCFIQLFRPSDQCFSVPTSFRYKPSRTAQTRKRARVNTPHNSSELSATLDVTNQSDCHDKSFDTFLKYFSATCNTDEFETLIEPLDLLDSNELQSAAQGSMPQTDSTIPSENQRKRINVTVSS